MLGSTVMLSMYKGETQMTENTAPTGQWCPQMSTCRSLEPVAMGAYTAEGLPMGGYNLGA